MKTLLAVVAALSCATSFAADWNHAANVRDGVKAFDDDYKRGGMSLLTADVAKCYSLGAQLPRKSDVKLRRLEFCMSMDMAAFQIDSYFSKSSGRPATPYFTEERLIDRFDVFDDWFQGSTKDQVFNGLMTQVSQQINAINLAGDNGAVAGPQGKYTGQGEGKLTLDIRAAVTGKFPVLLSTSAVTAGGGRCGGTLEGLGALSGNTLAVLAERDGERCEVTIEFSANRSRAEIEERRGCMSFHGPACGFTGSVQKR
jgi:hypothetical protein